MSSTVGINRAARQSWMLFAALVLAIACIVGGGLLALKVVDDARREVADSRTLAQQNAATSAALQKDVACITTWFDTYVGQQQIVFGASTARQDALDALVRLLNRPHVTVTEWNDLLRQYVTASNTYNNIIARNPIPAAPKLACG